MIRDKRAGLIVAVSMRVSDSFQPCQMLHQVFLAILEASRMQTTCDISFKGTVVG